MPTDKQRRDAQRRKLQRQNQRRREQALRRRRYNVIGSIVGAIVLIAVIAFVVAETSSDSSSNTSSASKTPSATTSAATPSPSATTTPSASSSAAVQAYPCTWTKTATPASRTVTVPPTTTPSRTGTVNVAVDTTQGAMTFTLNRAAAPCASESFLSLAAQKYFDKTPCHRLTSGTLNVLQCGDPTGTGTGGPGYSFDDELTGKEQYTTGVLAMANSGPNTNGSQFFIVYKDSTLGPDYTIFGTVSKGLDVVDKVAAKGSTPTGDGKPNLPISLTTVTQA